MTSIIKYKDCDILVSSEYYEHLKNIKWHIGKNGYVSGTINKKKWLMHRYIILELMKKPIDIMYCVDHKNGNRIDNTIENLQIVTKLDNASNMTKRNNTTSKYYGVSFDKSRNKWVSSILYKDTRLAIRYDNELFAAYQYNLWVKRYEMNKKLNDINKPLDFKELLIQKNLNIKGINMINESKYEITYNIYKKRYKLYSNNIDEAIKIKNQVENTKTNWKIIFCELKAKMCKIILNGNYIFKIGEINVIIDKDMYFNMYKFNWYVSKGNYIRCRNFELSRFIMNCNDINYVVDHINNNTLDNRRCNLRIVTTKENSMNKKKQINCSSKYIGVHKNKKKWIAQIVVNGENKHLGSFDREQDAALARDYATKKFFGEFGNLNFPERPGWDEYFMNICEVVKLRSQDYYKVGSVLVSVKNNRIISTGYNSIASNLNDNEINWSQRDLISDIVIHAEMNVLLYCESKFEESILYTTSSPCVNCLKMLSASKIKKIIYKHEYKDIDKVKKLAEFFKIELIKYENIK
jgi:dCMP deaminase